MSILSLNESAANSDFAAFEADSGWVDGPHRSFRWAKYIPMALAASGLLVDHRLGVRRCRGTPFISEYPAAAGAPADTAVLVTAGFNSKPEATADPLRDVFSRFGRVALFHDAACRFSLDSNYKTVAAWTRETKTKTLVFYGPSMGSMLNLAIASRLQQEENVEPLILFDGSPNGYENIKGTARRKTLRLLARAYGKYRGGPITRLGLETLGYNIDNWGTQKNPVSGLVHAFNKARDPGVPSNDQCQGRAHHIVTKTCSQYMAGLSDAPMVYIGTEDPDNDPVVDQPAAYASLQEHHPETILRFTDPRIGHANPATVPEPYQRVTNQALITGLGLPHAA